MQSAFRRTLFSSLPAVAVVFALASAAFGQLHPAAATRTTLSTAPATDASGKTVFTAHVSPVANAAGDYGTVTLEDVAPDGKVRTLGAAFVAADGVASITAALPAGQHSIRAVYGGTDAAAASTSTAAQVTADATAPNFALTAAPATLNLDAGVNGTVAITLTPGSGFSNYVALSCAGLPLYTTCSFLPSNVDVSTGATTSTMTLRTTAPSGKTSQLRESGSGIVYAFLLPGVLGLAGLAFGRNRGLRTLAILFVVGSVIGGASSCAQRYRYLNYGPDANPGTPNGESIIRVYGTAVTGALSTTQCFQVTLDVNNPENTSGTSGNSLIPCS